MKLKCPVSNCTCSWDLPASQNEREKFVSVVYAFKRHLLVHTIEDIFGVVYRFAVFQVPEFQAQKDGALT